MPDNIEVIHAIERPIMEPLKTVVVTGLEQVNDFSPDKRDITFRYVHYNGFGDHTEKTYVNVVVKWHNHGSYGINLTGEDLDALIPLLQTLRARLP